MNKRWKKVVSEILIYGLLISGLTTAAFAAFTDDVEVFHPAAVETLVELEIIDGTEDGSTFAPTSNVTRAEMAKMLCCVWSGGKPPFPAGAPLPDSIVAVPPDTETHWALPYIQFCIMNGLVAGRGDNTFDPDAEVTGLECAKMLLVSIGYLPVNERFIGAQWAENVRVRADEEQLFSGLSNFDPAAALSRDAAAQIIYNALTVPRVQYDYKLTTVEGVLVTTPVVVEVNPSVNLLSQHFAMQMVDGKLLPLS